MTWFVGCYVIRHQGFCLARFYYSQKILMPVVCRIKKAGEPVTTTTVTLLEGENEGEGE